MPQAAGTLPTSDDRATAGSAQAVKWDAFISYASSDRSTARRIQQFLERYRHPDRGRRLQVFLDVTDIRSGELGRSLGEELKSSRKLVVCASRASADSRWVDKEFAIFRGARGDGAVGVVLLDGEPDQVVPPAADGGTYRWHDLRRAFGAEFGVSPVEFAQTQRLLLAKRLLTDTAMPVTEVAFASGFGSLRRFNALFKQRYRMQPGRLRKHMHGNGAAASDALHFELSFRPPYDWGALSAFLGARTIAGVEAIEGGHYRRSARILVDGKPQFGWIDVSLSPKRPALRVTVAASLAKALPAALALADDLAWLVALIKPQFEAGREAVGKGGIVRDPDARARAVAQVQDWVAAQPHWRVVGVMASPIAGGSGNEEFLLGAVRGG